MNDTDRIRISPMSARAFTLQRGQSITVIDTAGGQPGDLVVLARVDHATGHDASRSRVENATCRPTVGHALWSGGPEPAVLLEITRDTAAAHDLLYPPCGRYALWKRFHVERDGCFEHLARALATQGVAPNARPDPLNLFFHVDVAADGRMSLGPHPDTPGQSITLRAAVECIAAVSTCSVPIAGRANTGYDVVIGDGQA